MSLGAYLVGLGFFGATLTCVLLGAGLVVRRHLAYLDGASLAVAFGLIATATYVAVHLLAGLLGMLNREVVLAVAVASLVGIRFLTRSAPGESRRSGGESPPGAGDPAVRRPPARSPASTLIAAVAVFAVAAYMLAVVLDESTVPPVYFDVVNLHLPGVASWIQEGNVWHSSSFFPGDTGGYYPNNGDLVELGATLPWRSYFLIKLVNVPFLALAALGVYALGRELRAPPSTAALLAAAVTSMRAVTVFTVEKPQPDPIMFAVFVAGLLFLLKHSRDQRTASLLLAGMGLGLAVGTKWYALPAVAVVFVAWMATRLLRRDAPARVARQGLALAGLISAGGVVWLVRNAAETGNPFFPLKLAPLGVTILDAPYIDPAYFGFTIAHFIGHSGVWGPYIWPALGKFLGLSALVVLGGTLLAAAPALPRARAGAAGWTRASLLAGAACSLALSIVYLVTPGSAHGASPEVPTAMGVNTRYAVPALLIAAPLAAWSIARSGLWRVVLELVALAAVVDGLRHGTRVSATAFLLGAAGVALIALAIRAGRRPGAWTLPAGLRKPIPAAGLGVLVLLCLAGLGYSFEKRFNDRGYGGQDAAIDWILTQAPQDHRIGLAGIWNPVGLQPILPAFGPRLGNHVGYVGHLDRGLLYAYRSRSGFDRALRDGRYDLLLLGRYRSSPSPKRIATWARMGGFSEIRRTSRFILFRLRS